MLPLTAVQLIVNVPLALDDGPESVGADAGGCRTCTVTVLLAALQPPTLQAYTL